MNRNTYSSIRVLRAPSSLTLSVSRDRASTTSLSNLFHCLTTLTVKNFFISKSALFETISLVLSQRILLLSVPFSYRPFLGMEKLHCSAWSLLSSRLNSPSSLSLSSQVRCSIPQIVSVALLWTCSNRSMSLLY